jgi:hypothetical protein
VDKTLRAGQEIMILFKYKNFEFSTYVKGVRHTWHLASYWLDVVTDKSNNKGMLKDFWYQLSGQYFSWYVDVFSNEKYQDMFYHNRHG